jgi:hypothetical protein
MNQPKPRGRGIPITPETRKLMPKRGPGKLTKTVKETVLAVFNELQGDPQHCLLAFAQTYPRDFYAIAAKLIPTEVVGQTAKQVIRVRIDGDITDAEIVTDEQDIES